MNDKRNSYRLNSRGKFKMQSGKIKTRIQPPQPLHPPELAEPEEAHTFQQRSQVTSA